MADLNAIQKMRSCVEDAQKCAEQLEDVTRQMATLLEGKQFLPSDFLEQAVAQIKEFERLQENCKEECNAFFQGNPPKTREELLQVLAEREKELQATRPYVEAWQAFLHLDSDDAACHAALASLQDSYRQQPVEDYSPEKCKQELSSIMTFLQAFGEEDNAKRLSYYPVLSETFDPVLVTAVIMRQPKIFGGAAAAPAEAPEKQEEPSSEDGGSFLKAEDISSISPEGAQEMSAPEPEVEAEPEPAAAPEQDADVTTLSVEALAAETERSITEDQDAGDLSGISAEPMEENAPEPEQNTEEQPAAPQVNAETGHPARQGARPAWDTEETALPVSDETVRQNFETMLSEEKYPYATAYLFAAQSFDSKWKRPYAQLAFAINDPRQSIHYDSPRIARVFGQDPDILSGCFMAASTLRAFFYNDAPEDAMMQPLMNMVAETEVVKALASLHEALQSLMDFKAEHHRGADCYAAYRKEDAARDGEEGYPALANKLRSYLEGVFMQLPKWAEKIGGSAAMGGAMVVRLAVGEILARMDGSYRASRFTRYFYIDFLSGSQVLLNDAYLPDDDFAVKGVPALHPLIRIEKQWQESRTSLRDRLELICTGEDSYASDNIGSLKLMLSYMKEYDQGVVNDYAEECERLLKPAHEQELAQKAATLRERCIEDVRTAAEANPAVKEKEEVLLQSIDLCYEHMTALQDYGSFGQSLAEIQAEIVKSGNHEAG